MKQEWNWNKKKNRPQPRRYLDIRGPLRCPRGRNFKSRAKIRDVLKMARTNA